ncbi:MAG: hypothetical protein ACREAF_00835 [Nitrosopumilaceae archaeon]
MSKLDIEKQKRLGTNLILICALFLVTYVGIRYVNSQIVVILAEAVLIGLSFWFIMSIKKEGFAPALAAIMGCSIFVLVVLLPVNIPTTAATLDPLSFTTESIEDRIAHMKEKRGLAKEYGMYIGLFNLAMGMALAYRPSLIYVKNRISDELPYPVWDSKKQYVTRFNPSLVPVRSLLNEKERWFIFKYKFVLVLIDNKTYLVKPDDSVPETAILLRSKSGQSPLGM